MAEKKRDVSTWFRDDVGSLSRAEACDQVLQGIQARLFRLQIADPLDKQPDWQAAVRELEDTIDDLMSAVVTLLKMVKAMPEGD
jgi:hypothetical protein